MGKVSGICKCEKRWLLVRLKWKLTEELLQRGKAKCGMGQGCSADEGFGHTRSRTRLCLRGNVGQSSKKKQ